MSMHLALIAGLALLGPADDDAKAGLDKLQGTWKAVEFESGGKKVDKEEYEKYELVITDNRFVLKGGEDPFRGTLKVDPSQSPATIDAAFIDAEGAEHGKALGIYKLDGDRLTVCWDQGKDAQRPTEFTTRPETGLRLMSFRREKR